MQVYVLLMHAQISVPELQAPKAAGSKPPLAPPVLADSASVAVHRRTHTRIEGREAAACARLLCRTASTWRAVT